MSIVSYRKRRSFERLERDREVVKLYRDGKSQFEIATALGCSQPVVSRALAAWREELRKQGSEDMLVARGRIVDYLTGLLNVHYPLAIGDNPEKTINYKSANVVLRALSELITAYGLNTRLDGDDGRIGGFDLLRELALEAQERIEALPDGMELKPQ